MSAVSGITRPRVPVQTPRLTATSGAAQPRQQDSVSTGDARSRVMNLIADIRSGKIKWAPEIQQKTRQTELTLGNFPCHKYILHAGKKPIDSLKLPTEIVPRHSKPRYEDNTTVDSKLSEKENRKDLAARVSSISDGADEVARQKGERVMVMVEGDNANGKDGIFKHVFRVSPLTNSGVHSIKAPKGDEKGHEFTYRGMKALPDPGQFSFLNRTLYGDVVFGCDTHEKKAACEAAIMEWEYGVTNGLPMTPEGRIALPDAKGHVDPSAIQGPPTRLIKIFCSVSKAEQAARLAARIDDENRRDKMSPADVKGHPEHDDVQTGFANAFASTSTPWAPSYFIPNDNKLTGHRKTAQIVDEVIKDMDPHRPGGQVTARDRAVSRQLKAEVERHANK